MNTIYTAGRVLAGPANTEILNAAVWARDGLIVAVGPRNDVQELAKQERSINTRTLGSDVTILPGLIDTHVHLAFDGGPDPVSRLQAAGHTERLGIMLHSARELLSAGVTTARDLGAPDLLDRDVKHFLSVGLARGPRLQTVTAPITVTGGHCWFFGGECDGVEGVRRQVRRARRDGADAIKIMATGGNMTPGTMPSEPQFTEPELRAMVAEAHKYGLRVTAHGHGGEGIRRAIEAGVDSIEHFSFTRADGSYLAQPSVVSSAIGSGVYLCRTICSAWTTKIRELFPETMLRALVDAGGKVVAGTDAGIDNCRHIDYVTGLEGMAAFGMTHGEVLHSATLLAAESLGLADITGSIESHKSADLIAVRGDPRENLGVLRDLSLVVAQGQEYSPEFVSTARWNACSAEPQYVPSVRD